MDQKICIVTATREKTIDDFKKNTLLGKSLSIQTYFDIEILCFVDNTDGLSACYNRAIKEPNNANKILVFVHDDVALLDYYWPLRVRDALKNYDIVGVAGNVRHNINFPSWAHSHSNGAHVCWDDDENLSGCMLHGSEWPPAITTVYGELNKQVVNLDGVFIAANNKILLEKDVYFDERFNFHFYDADFCKNSVNKQLKLGTFPLALMHGGKGNMSDINYINSYHEFNRKYTNEFTNN